MSYVRPKSLAWWAGVALIAMGFVAMFVPSNPVTMLSQVLAALVGTADASPVGLILGGLGLIGVRAKLERDLPPLGGR